MGDQAATASAARTFGFASIAAIGMLGALQGIEPGIANIAFTSVVKDYDVSGSMVALASSIGTLSLAATVMAVGAIADRVGVRRIIVIGLVLGILGDLSAAFSPNLTIYMLGRAIAGIGMGAIFMGAFSMVPEIAGKKSVPAVIGQWTGMLYVLLITFSVIGALLVGINWRYAFYLVPALCALMIPVVLKTLPETTQRGTGRPDLLGLVLLGIGMVALLSAISAAAVSRTSPTFVGSLVVAIIGLGGWVIVQKRSANPSFPIKLFASPVFIAAVLAGLLWNFADASMLLQSANFWQAVPQVAPGVVGVSQMPLLIAAAIAGFTAGALMAKGRSPVVIMAIGVVLLAVSLFSVSFTNADTKVVAFIPGLIGVGAGMVLVGTVQAREYVAEAPEEFRSAVIASRTAVGQLGYATGLALTSAILTAGISNEATGEVSSDPGLYADSFNNTMRAAALVVLVLGAIAVLLLRRGLARRGNNAATESPELAEP